MSTTSANPVSSLPSELEKTSSSLALSLVATALSDETIAHYEKKSTSHLTFVVDLTPNAAHTKSSKDSDDVTTCLVEPLLDCLSAPPPSPGHFSSQSLSSSTADISSSGTAPESDASDSEAADTPRIDPPGLPKPECDQLERVSVSIPAPEDQAFADTVNDGSTERTEATTLEPEALGEILDVDKSEEHKEVISHHTFVVDLTHNAACPQPSKSQSSDSDASSMFSGEQQLGSLSDPLPSAHPLSSNPLSSSEVDLSSAGTAVRSDASGSETVDTPGVINPPGLPVREHLGSVGTSALKVQEVQDAAGVVSVQNAEKVSLESGPPDKIAHVKTSAFDEHLDRFSLSGLSKLDTFIPDSFLPDDLLVYDHDNVTTLCPDEGKRDVPVRYVRMYPKTSRENGDSRYAYDCRDPNTPPRIAHLYVKKSNKLGTGNHSSVYRAPLRLRLDPECEEWSTVSVAVKTAFSECGAHFMLHKEAVAYNAFPRRLMEDHYPASCSCCSRSEERAAPVGVVSDESRRACEPDAGTDSATPGPAVKEPGPPGEGIVSTGSSGAPGTVVQTHKPVPEPAVAPKFYGYYSAVNGDGTLISRSHIYCGEYNACTVSWPTRLLLVEECGKPVHHFELTHEKRSECFKLYERLHDAGFVNGSAYTRNMLMQPGPLSAPYNERSYDTPSFRIIDFGRAEVLSLLREGEEYTFECSREDEIDRARRHLRL